MERFKWGDCVLSSKKNVKIDTKALLWASNLVHVIE